MKIITDTIVWALSTIIRLSIRPRTKNMNDAYKSYKDEADARVTVFVDMMWLEIKGSDGAWSICIESTPYTGSKQDAADALAAEYGLVPSEELTYNEFYYVYANPAHAAAAERRRLEEEFPPVWSLINKEEYVYMKEQIRNIQIDWKYTKEI